MKRLLNNLQKRRRERKEAPIKSLENAKNLPTISSLTSSRSRGGKKFYKISTENLHYKKKTKRRFSTNIAENHCKKRKLCEKNTEFRH